MRASMRQSRWLLLALLILVLVIFFPTNPVRLTVPVDDSAFFLYTGTKILDGELPYVDVWDSKPPLIFYINALAVLLGGSTRWGIWLLEIVAVGTAALLSFLTFIRVFGSRLVAFFSTAAWLLSFVLLHQEGNQIEEFALPVMFWLLWLVCGTRADSNRLKDFAVGLASGTLFMLKQNLIAIPLSIGLFILVEGMRSRQWRSMLEQLAWIGFGGLLLIGFIAGYFAVRGALGEMWVVGFETNFSYIAAPLNWRVGADFIGLQSLAPGGMMFAAVAGWIVAATMLPSGKLPRLVRLALIILPIDILLTTLSGRAFFHYFMAWLPGLAILTAFVASLIHDHGNGEPVIYSGLRRQISLSSIGLVGGLVAMTLLPFKHLEEKMESPAEGYTYELISLIETTTDPDDTILVWGYEPTYYLMARRDAPTRFIYQHGLFYQLSDTAQAARNNREFVQDVTSAPPGLIVDASYGFGLVPDLQHDSTESWSARWGGGRLEYQPELAPFFVFVQDNYTLVDTIGPFNWRVYRLRNAQ